MRLEKLDTGRDYGTIFGHPSAKFEQDGCLFDQQGRRLGAAGAAAAAADDPEQGARTDEEGVAKAKAFLSEVLAGGALTREGVLKEAEDAHLLATYVNEAAKEACLRYQTGKGRDQVTYWKLKE